MKNTAIILILISLGLFYTFTRDEYSKVKSLSTLASQYRDSLQNVSEIGVLRDNLLNTYNALPATDIDRLRKILPDNNDTVKLALELDHLAGLHGISLRTIRVDDPLANSGGIELPSTDPYRKVEVRIEFVSDYDDFMAFLIDLERNLRITNVKSIIFQVSDAPLYEHSVTLETYWIQ